MKNNPISEFWDNLYLEFEKAFNRELARNLLRSGNIIIKNLDDTHVSFQCPTGLDKRMYSETFIEHMSFILKKVRPTLTHMIINVSRHPSSNKIIVLK